MIQPSARVCALGPVPLWHFLVTILFDVAFVLRKVFVLDKCDRNSATKEGASMPNRKNVSVRTVNQRLIDERRQRQWSQQELANRIGTTPQNVSRWERGVTSPNPYYRQQLCAIFSKNSYELGLLPPTTELSDQSDLFAPSRQIDPQTGPLVSDPEQEGLLASQFQAMALLLPALEEGKEKIKRSSILDTPAGRPLWKLLLPLALARRVPISWLVTLSVVLVLALTTSTLFQLDTVPAASSTNPISISKERAKGNVPHLIGAKISMRVPVPIATATPVDTAVPPAYGAHGELVLDDPLTSSHTQGVWHIATDAHKLTGCDFFSDGYHMTDDSPNYCLADETDFSDFIYQIDMATIQGGTAGIVFRVNDSQDSYYNFQISADGHYCLYRSSSASDSSDPVLGTGWSSAIVQGYHHDNLLAVKAVGDTLSLYVNFRLLAHFQDRFYTHGNVGVYVMVTKGQSITDAVFHNARVWRI
jgi:transcriptional regulator with XRE-family HTH domain